MSQHDEIPPQCTYLPGRYGIIKDYIRQTVKRHEGRDSDESIDAYERMSIFCSQNVASLQDL